MACWTVIPVKPFIHGKSRLAEVLGPEERERLARAMFGHVIDAASAAGNVAKVCLLGASRQGLSDHLTLLSDPGGGLNPALQSALAELSGEAVTRMLVLFGDLPLVRPGEVELLAAGSADTVLVAPDRHETGTNALSLPLPSARAFQFAFGAGSFAKHRAETKRLGLKLSIIRSKGLARDVDEPGDLADAEALKSERQG